MAPVPDQIERLVEEWIRLDPNADTRNEIQRLWEARNLEELDSRLTRRIQFGTAGLRGRMAAGWACMNDLIIIQTAQGLAEYVLQNVQDSASRGLVVAYDHRHNSKHWAELTAQVFHLKNVKVHFLTGYNHTPMVPFTVKQVNAACGVMITASHNPKDDNGFKVYWENAVQIISPHDTGISGSIQKNLVPIFQTKDNNIPSQFDDITEDLQQKYIQYLGNLVSSGSSQKPIIYVNTSLHGVSDAILSKAFAFLEYPSYVPVQQQQKPDPLFSTVLFPNPEEKDALNLAQTTANAVGAKYIFAQDPDADRFSAAEKLVTGQWKVFTGDQLGVIFASKILSKYQQSGQSVEAAAFIASTVSSKMLACMAKQEGFKYQECLTGFKFIGNTALNLESSGYKAIFGYEEAIGYMFGDQIYDKDGIAATMLFVELIYELQYQNKTVSIYLDELYAKYGYFETCNSYFICKSPKVIDDIFTNIRHHAGTQTYPITLGGLQITRVIDLSTGYDSGNPPSFVPALPLSSGHMIQFIAQTDNLIEQLFLTLRTSGTEPKIKFYLEGNGSTKAAIQSLLSQTVEDITSNWVQASFTQKFLLRILNATPNENFTHAARAY